MSKTRDSQKARILRHLQSGKTITSLQSFHSWTFTRLSSPIQLLRDEGWDIRDRKQTASNGEEFSEYYLHSPVQGPKRLVRTTEKDVNTLIDEMAIYILSVEKLGQTPANGQEIINKLAELVRHKDAAAQASDPVLQVARLFKVP